MRLTPLTKTGRPSARTTGLGALSALLVLALTACTPGAPVHRSSTHTTEPVTKSSATPTPAPLPDGVIATATITTPEGSDAGTLTITASGGQVALAFPASPVHADTLRLTTAAADACSDSSLSFAQDSPDRGIAVTLDPTSIVPDGDPTFFRSVQLTTLNEAPSACLFTTVGSGTIEWKIAPRGLSTAVEDSGPAEFARGTVVTTGGSAVAYTPARGDTPIGVASRLGITLADLEWLNPMRAGLQAGMPINLDPARRGQPVDAG